MLIYVIRHGETAYNAAGRLQGKLDIPLNENGIALARETGKGMKNIKFDVVYSSPLSRAYQTAEIILEECSCIDVPIIKDERLIEMSFGDWDGLCCAKDNFEIPSDNFSLFYTDPFELGKFPNGESVQIVIERTAEFYDELIQNKALQDKTILLSMHACAMRGLLNRFYEDKRNYWHTHVPYNCAVNIIKVENGQGSLIGEDIIYYDANLCENKYK